MDLWWRRPASGANPLASGHARVRFYGWRVGHVRVGFYGCPTLGGEHGVLPAFDFPPRSSRTINPDQNLNPQKCSILTRHPRLELLKCRMSNRPNREHHGRD
jgi:hypothetical protein